MTDYYWTETNTPWIPLWWSCLSDRGPWLLGVRRRWWAPIAWWPLHHITLFSGTSTKIFHLRDFKHGFILVYHFTCFFLLDMTTILCHCDTTKYVKNGGNCRQSYTNFSHPFVPFVLLSDIFEHWSSSHAFPNEHTSQNRSPKLLKREILHNKMFKDRRTTWTIVYKLLSSTCSICPDSFEQSCINFSHPFVHLSRYFWTLIIISHLFQWTHISI
jgi:hypothetical protein